MGRRRQMLVFHLWALLGVTTSLSLAQEPVQVDVLVVYNDLAVQKTGGVGPIVASAERNIGVVNDVFDVSGVNVHLNLVGVHWIDYPQVIDTRQDLIRLREPDDGHMDDIHVLRDALGADLVHMVCGPREGFSTGPWESGAYSVSLRGFEEDNPALAFSISRPRYFDYEYSLLWALAVQMGVQDQWSNIVTIFPDASGHVFQGQSGGWYRTYWGAPVGPGGEPATTIYQISNSQVLYDGTPTGISGEAENAAVINRLADYVASYREPQGTTVHLLDDWALLHEREGASAEFEVGVFPPPAVAVDVPWELRDWTGAAGIDTVESSGTVRLEPPLGRGSIAVHAAQDSEIEGTEEIHLLLGEVPGAGLGAALANLMVLDDESASAGTLDHILGMRGLQGNEALLLDTNDDGGIDVADLVWQLDPSHVREEIVDNRDPGFSVPLGARRTTNFHIGWPNGEGDYFYAIGVGSPEEPVARAEWRPVIQVPGDYEVSTWYVTGPNRPSDARYTVHSTSGDETIVVNQLVSGEQWVPLGIHSFDHGDEGHVTLSNQCERDKAVIMDAVRFRCVRVGGPRGD